MYLSFVKEVPEDYYMKNVRIFKTKVYFTTPDEINNVVDFIKKFGIDEYRKIFDMIGIKYTSVNVEGLSYFIGEEILYLHNLSSGERCMLYAFIMQRLNRPFIMIGLIDRLDGSHRRRLIKYLGETDIVVLTYRTDMSTVDVLDKYYKKFEDLIKEGII